MNQAKPASRKAFGLWSATFLVVANMIGAGVFTTSGFSLADLGDPKYVMLTWAIGAAIAICGAVSYGQLAQRLSESGGEYLFLSRFVHPSVGFIAGWVSLLAGFTGAIAFAATAFESYVLPDAIRPEWLRPGMIGIGTILVFGLLHSLLLKTGLITQNLVVATKIFMLLAFIAFSFSKFPTGWVGMHAETAAVPFSIYGIASTLVWISLSFSGFNAAVYVTGEVDNPKTNVPRALLIGTLVVSLMYLALNAIFVYGPAPDVVKGAPDVAAIASRAIGGDGLATLIRLIVSVALLSSVSSMIVAGPRVYAKMADDGLFPKIFKSAWGHHETPAAAIWLQVAMASVVVYFSTLKSLLDHLGFTLSVSAAITVACVFWSRRDGETSGQRILFTGIAFVYVSSTVVLAILSAIGRPQQLVGFTIIVLTGLLAYFSKFNRVRKV